MRMIRSSPKPDTLRQISAASSSSENTVTISLSLGRPKSLVTSSQAYGIAFSLK